MGCSSLIPTKCRGSSVESKQIALDCAAGELCCRFRPNTACFTWLTTESTATYTLFECRSTTGVGTLVAMPTGLPVTTPISVSTLGETDKISPPSTGATSRTAVSPFPTSISVYQSGEAPPGAVAASIAGALALLGVIAGGVVYLWSRDKKKRKRQGTGVHRRGSLAISGPFLLSGAPPKIPRPPRVHEMSTYDAQQKTSSTYSSDGRGSEGTAQVEHAKPPRRPRRSGDFGGGWI
nr:uncharacterized protein CTRU02_08485 [Colletotrichum truncatum]KAF6789786.1 hypothetical protein CTRU02_08485 [Colletotrichum truncatum]